MQTAYPSENDNPCPCRCGKDASDCDCPDLIRMLDSQIAAVRALRSCLETRAQLLHEFQIGFNRAHSDLIELKCEAETELAIAEAELRRLTLWAYSETGTKKPAKGVGIRISKKLQYDEDSIKHWAIQEGHIMFLALDRAGFEGWAKATMKSGKLPGSLHESGAAINETEIIMATIAKEL